MLALHVFKDLFCRQRKHCEYLAAFRIAFMIVIFVWGTIYVTSVHELATNLIAKTFGELLILLVVLS